MTVGLPTKGYSPVLPPPYGLLCASALAAGGVNVIAGGGTLLTFPALLAVLPPVMANATSTVALVPGSFAGAWGFRAHLAGQGRWLRLLVGPSLAGGLAGALLLTRLPERYFAWLVPWLILTATLLLLAQPLLVRRSRGSRPLTPATGWALAALVIGQFLVAVYGGYFGAGAGIMMLSGFSLMGIGDMHAMNAVKNTLAVAINGISILVFAAQGHVAWGIAGAMVVTATLGGYAAARLARHVRPPLVRATVVAIGLGLSVFYFLSRPG